MQFIRLPIKSRKTNLESFVYIETNKIASLASFEDGTMVELSTGNSFFVPDTELELYAINYPQYSTGE